MDIKKNDFCFEYFEKTSFQNLIGYPVEQEFQFVNIEIDESFFFLVRGIYNKCFYEGLFSDQKKALIEINNIKKGEN